MTCDRCGRTNVPLIMSKFNTEMICDDGDESCKAKERRHPKYAAADAAEVQACLRGEYDFPGIGKPADL